MNGDLRTTLLGELRLQLRQPLSLLMLLVLPVLLGLGAALTAYAVAESGAEKLIEEQAGLVQREADDGDAPKRVDPDDDASPVHVPPEWVDRLQGARNLELVDESEAHATLIYVEGEPTVEHRVSFEGMRASSALKATVQRVLRDERDATLREAGLGFDPDDIVRIQVVDRSTEDQRTGASLGAMIPGMLTFALLIAALVTALDVFTGEKERGTIETLLTTGIDRRAVVAAKLGVVAAATGFAGLVFLVTLTLAPLTIGGGPIAGLGATELLALVSIDLVLAAQVASITSIVAIYADDYKSASMLSAPLMLGVMAPVAAPFFPVELGPLLAAIPLANVALASRDLLSGSLTPAAAAGVLGFSAVHVGLAAWAVGRMLDRETALIGTGSVLLPGGERSRVREGIGLFALVFCGMWFFAQTAQVIDLVGGMIFTQIVVIAMPAVAAIWWLGMPLGPTLSLRAPSVKDGLLAAGIGIVAPSCGMLVFVAQSQFMPAPESLYEGLSVISEDRGSLWIPLLVFCALPAVCEELLFRGALLGLLRRGATPAIAIGLCALMFGLFHIAVHRWAPTGVLGLLAAIAVWRSGSLWTGVLIHFGNNAVALGLTAYGTDLVDDFGAVGPTAALLAGATLAFGGAFAMGQRATNAE